MLFRYVTPIFEGGLIAHQNNSVDRVRMSISGSGGDRLAASGLAYYPIYSGGRRLFLRHAQVKGRCYENYIFS